MRLCWLMLLTIGCSPESHVLLSTRGDAGGGLGTQDAGGEPVLWTECNVPFDDGTGQTGDSCDFSGACSYDIPNPSGARCLRGEFLVATITPEGSSDTACTGTPVETNSAGSGFEVTGYPEPGCFSARACDSTTSSYRLFRYCQRGPREALRADASAAYTSCAAAVSRGRDGDACAGEFVCHDTVDGHGLIAWCDDGILRLGPDYPFYQF